MQGKLREAIYKGQPVQVLGPLRGNPERVVISFRDGTRAAVPISELNPVVPSDPPPRPDIRTKGGAFELPGSGDQA